MHTRTACDRRIILLPAQQVKAASRLRGGGCEIRNRGGKPDGRGPLRALPANWGGGHSRGWPSAAPAPQAKRETGSSWPRSRAKSLVADLYRSATMGSAARRARGNGAAALRTAPAPQAKRETGSSWPRSRAKSLVADLYRSATMGFAARRARRNAAAAFRAAPAPQAKRETGSSWPRSRAKSLIADLYRSATIGFAARRARRNGAAALRAAPEEVECAHPPQAA